MHDLIVVTAGAGFIGSNFLLQRMRDQSAAIVNFDRLTYAGNPHNLESIAGDPRYNFVQGDIVDRELLQEGMGGPKNLQAKPPSTDNRPSIARQT